MSWSLLEQARSLHGEIEREREFVIDQLLNGKTTSLKDEITSSHRIRRSMEKMAQHATSLTKYYKDEQGVRAREFDLLAGDGDDHSLFSSFYEQVNQIRDFYKSHPIPSESSSAVPQSLEQLVDFSGDEFSGKYLDLQPYFQQYLNCKSFKRIKYPKYLRIFSDFSAVAPSAKTREYREYLNNLLKYLESFHERVHPLYPVQKISKRISDEFYKCIAENDPLYCAVCCRSFAKQTVFDHHLAGKKHSKAEKSEQGRVPTELVEEMIRCYSTLLQGRIVATIRFVESLQTRTFQEIYAERTRESDEEIDEDSDKDDENGVIYNPLKIPLGWDGKPIPYWLYKLHGLNIEYTCQICGDFSYWGPRAFEQHFNEWRHINGLRALGIPNSVHFKNITQMEDAVILYHKIQDLDKNRVFRPEQDEEFEDEEGNVFNKRTYDDLRKQGLI